MLGREAAAIKQRKQRLAPRSLAGRNLNFSSITTLGLTLHAPCSAPSHHHERMSLGRPSVLQRGAQSVYSTPGPSRSDLKRRFFSCFAPSQQRTRPSPSSTLLDAPLRFYPAAASSKELPLTPRPSADSNELRLLDASCPPYHRARTSASQVSSTSTREPPPLEHEPGQITVHDVLRLRGESLETRILDVLPDWQDWGLASRIAAQQPLPGRPSRIASLQKVKILWPEEEYEVPLVRPVEHEPSFGPHPENKRITRNHLRRHLATDARNESHTWPTPDAYHPVWSDQESDPGEDGQLFDEALSTTNQAVTPIYLQGQKSGAYMLDYSDLELDLAELMGTNASPAERLEQAKLVGRINSGNELDRSRGSVIAIDAITSVTLNHPRGDSETTPMFVNYRTAYNELNTDALVEKWGEAAYDWREPLELLTIMSAPLSEEDVQRFTSYAMRQRELRSSSVLVLDRRAESIGPPPSWNAESLTQHIHDLSRARFQLNLYTPHSDSSLLEERQAMHRTRERILTLFVDEENQPHLTRAAFQAAIEFMETHGFPNDGQRLMDFMTELNLKPSIEELNHRFRKIAKQRNLAVFTKFVQTIKMLDIKPDAYTWCAFYICIGSSVVRRIILEQMRRLGYLNYEPVLKVLAPYAIRTALEQYLESERSIPGFIQQFNEDYGVESFSWMSHATLKIMLQILLFHRRIEEIGELLKLWLRLRPDDITARDVIEALLLMCRDVGHPGAAILVVHLVEQDRLKRTTLSDRSIRLLFNTLYKHGLANSCRAVWQFACVKGAVDAHLKDKVELVLSSPPHEYAEPLKDANSRFLSYESKIILGRNFMLDWTKYWDDWFKHSVPHARADLLANIGKTMILADTQIHGQWAFQGSLARVLQDTLRMDLAWKKRPEVLRGDVGWMVKNAYNLPLTPYRGPSLAHTGPTGRWFTWWRPGHDSQRTLADQQEEARRRMLAGQQTRDQDPIARAEHSGPDAEAWEILLDEHEKRQKLAPYIEF